MANTIVVEANWLRQLLDELHSPRPFVVLLILSTNPVRPKHVEIIMIDLHFVRERVGTGRQVRFFHVPGRNNNVLHEWKSSIIKEAADMSFHKVWINRQRFSSYHFY